MNSDLFRASACLLALILAAACGERSAPAAADGTAAFTAAADALAAKLKSGPPPADDPSVKAFEAETAKALETLGTPALPLRGFESFEALCGKTGTIVVAYLDRGVATAASQEEQMKRNAAQYLDQMFTPLLFSAHCSAEHMPYLEKHGAGQLNSNRAALQQVRDGAYNQATGMLQMAGDKSLDMARRRRVVDLLAADAGKFAIVLSPAQRQSLAKVADQVHATLAEPDRPGIDRIKAGLAGAPCGPLCRM